MEPFKNHVNADVVRAISRELGGLPAFERAALEGLDELELKARIEHLARRLREHLDDDFEVALGRLVDASETLGLWAVWPLCTFVELFGLDHWDASFAAMKVLTTRATCEFAVRPFLVADEPRAMATLLEWTEDPNEHVRRLTSEGSRPRLPWGLRLRSFVADPGPVLPLLERLRADPARYVQRSVANNLNDIAKDHPEVVVELGRRWWAEGGKAEGGGKAAGEAARGEQRWIVKHALRSLVKAGHPGALDVLGFGPPRVRLVELGVSPEALEFGTPLQIDAVIECQAEQQLVIDYALHYVKANGSSAPKVFKWSTRGVSAGQRLTLSKKHGFKPISTRRHYPGAHAVELLINGQSMGRTGFELACERGA